MKNSLFSILILMLVPTMAGAQENSTREKAWAVGLGSVNILDTYISQEKYRGEELRFVSYSAFHGTKHPNVVTQITHEGSLQTASPRSEDADDIAGSYTFSYALRREWNPNHRLSFQAGAQAELALGFLYNSRNGNNPAQLKCGLNISPSGVVAWQLPLWRKVFLLRYEVSAPLVGAMFSPNYGQSYYEIFSRGNYDHNIVFTTPLNAPSLKQMLTVDIPIRRTILRVGYLGDFRQAEVNSLKYHTYSHLLVIGLTRHI